MDHLRRYALEQESAKNTPLIRNIIAKREMLLQGDSEHKSISPALIIMGGGMRGVYGGGVVTELEKEGLTDVFDVTVGISAGACDVAYFLSGQAKLGTSIYYEDLANKKFINPARLNKIMDVDYLDYIFRFVKPLDQEQIKRSRSEFYIGVTNAKTGKGEMIDAKSENLDIIDLVRASGALPIAYNRPVNIKGVDYCDGQIGNGIPINLVFQKGCTDVLIVFNSPLQAKDDKGSAIEKFLSKLYMRKFTPEFRTATLTRNVLFNQTLGSFGENDKVNIGILAPTAKTVSRMSKDSRAMEQAARQAEEQVHQLFTSNYPQ